MSTFNGGNMLQTRYTNLIRPGVVNTPPSSDEEEEDDPAKAKASQEYATFLREKERKVGPEGFLDSSKHQHAFTTKKDKKERKNDKSGDSVQVTVIDLRDKNERDEKEHQKRLKMIEDHMWQHKQEERELKRLEGDIIKKQRHIRRTLRDYESAVMRKRMSEEKKLSQNQERYTSQQRQQVHEMEVATKQRTEQNVASEQACKDMGRKVQLTTSHLTREYMAKRAALDLKTKEANRLSRDFESKLRQKEAEQYRLKQELAELAIALNMEAQKGRQNDQDNDREARIRKQKRMESDRDAQKDVTTRTVQSEADTKGAEMNRRKMSAELSLTKSHMQLKQREEGRHRQDTDTRLRSNIVEQKALNNAATDAEMDLKSKRNDQKVQAHDQRRRILAARTQHQKQERTEQQEAQLMQRFQKRLTEQQMREHEDHLKHFQKTVQKGDELEYNLYNRVKNTEYARQKQEQSVRKLNSRVQEMKRENAVRIKDEMSQLMKQEREAEQKLLREQAQLAKVHAEREECYGVLQKHRDVLRQDKYLLGEHEREHERLVRVASRTQQSMSQSYG